MVRESLSSIYRLVSVADIYCVMIKVRAVGVTVWRVLVVNVRLSPVSRPSFYQAIMIYLNPPWPVQCQTVGASMGLRAACPAHQKTCQISCQDPTSSQECVTLSSLLIDGSPCGMCYHLVQF